MMNLFTILVTPEKIGIDKLNYFAIVRTKTPRTEIHLPKYNHTNLSRATNKLQEVTKDYMWTIQVPSVFKYAHEWINIKEAYPDFERWVQSGGSDKQDWYNKPVTEKLYQK